MKPYYIILALVLTGRAGSTNANPLPRLNVYLFLQSKCPCVFNHKDSFGGLLREYDKQVSFTVVFAGGACTRASMENLLRELNWKVPYKKDTRNTLVHELKPAVSTDCVVVNSVGRVLYRGAIDDGFRNMGRIKNFYLKEVIAAYLQQKPIPYASAAAGGCRIME